MHLDDTPKKLGIALFVLYLWQLLGGSLIHFAKSKSKTRPRRPAQNHAHAVLGLLLIALAFWQVRTGYTHEYPEWTTGTMPIGAQTLWLWIVWVVLIPVFYLAGLALLPRQLDEESAAKAGKQEIGCVCVFGWGERGGGCTSWS